MYEKFYGFRSKPFSLLPDPEFLYPSRKHRMALTLLEYGLMNQASFSVITGDIGTGKTTLIRQLLNQMERDLVVGLITNTHPSFGDLLQWVLLAFNLECPGKDKVDMYKTFTDFLIKKYAANRRTVLIVDEAQNLSSQALEELRMLSNINSEKDQVLQVILAGQPGLRENLRDPRLEQFAQRIAVDYNLEPLNAEEMREYIRHRVRIAGGDDNLFDDDACEAVHRYSGGIPRLANLLCDTALVYGYAEQTRSINQQLIDDVARDKQQNRILPLRQQAPGGDSTGPGNSNHGTSPPPVRRESGGFKK
jgi:general secretion pathway protein A